MARAKFEPRQYGVRASALATMSHYFSKFYGGEVLGAMVQRDI